MYCVFFNSSWPPPPTLAKSNFVALTAAEHVEHLESATGVRYAFAAKFSMIIRWEHISVS